MLRGMSSRPDDNPKKYKFTAAFWFCHICGFETFSSHEKAEHIDKNREQESNTLIPLDQLTSLWKPSEKTQIDLMLQS